MFPKDTFLNDTVCRVKPGCALQSEPDPGECGGCGNGRPRAPECPPLSA